MNPLSSSVGSYPYINAHYRMHHQDAVYFWTNNLSVPVLSVGCGYKF